MRKVVGVRSRSSSYIRCCLGLRLLLIVMYSKAPRSNKMHGLRSGPPPHPPFLRPGAPPAGYVLGEIINDDNSLSSPPTFPYLSQPSQYHDGLSAQSAPSYPPRNPGYQQEFYRPDSNAPYGDPRTESHQPNTQDDSTSSPYNASLGNRSFVQRVSEPRCGAPHGSVPYAAPSAYSSGRYNVAEGGPTDSPHGTYLGYRETVSTRQPER